MMENDNNSHGKLQLEKLFFVKLITWDLSTFYNQYYFGFPSPPKQGSSYFVNENRIWQNTK